ncbi:MAG TPA: Hpt domain-containing protein [Aliidongia sp.]|nr:Hpt domain-containing protein [Aliidongia sp.]
MSDTLLDLAILNELERRLGRERVAKVLTVQLANGIEQSRRLEALEAALDRPQIKAIAHQMAGSSGSIGLLGLSREAAALEDAASIRSEAELRELMSGLRACLDESQRRLVEQYPEIGPL